MDILDLDSKTDKTNNVYKGFACIEGETVGEFTAKRCIHFGKEAVELKKIYVEEDFRQCRIATGIVSSIITWAKNYDYSLIVGNIKPNNPCSCNEEDMKIILSKMGFIIDGLTFSMNLS